MNKFKPIESLENQEDLQRGDLIFLKAKRVLRTGGAECQITSVLYNGLDSYVSNGEGSIEKDTEFPGIRIFQKSIVTSKGITYSALGYENNNTVFDDRQKGLLIPFNYNPATEHDSHDDFSKQVSHEYALVAKANDLPKFTN